MIIGPGRTVPPPPSLFPRPQPFKIGKEKGCLVCVVLTDFGLEGGRPERSTTMRLPLPPSSSDKTNFQYGRSQGLLH